MKDASAPSTPPIAVAGLRRAVASIQRNDVAGAEEALSQVLQAAPHDAGALQLLGDIRRTQNRLAEAEELYRLSLASHPAQAQVYYRLGLLSHTLGRQREALDLFQEAARLKPNDADAHLALGLVHYDLKEFAEAEKHLNRTLRLQPNHIPARQSLGALLNDMGRPKEAERILRRALANGPADRRQIAALEHNLGVSLSQQRQYEAALSLFDSAQARAADLPMVDSSRANTLQHLGKFAAAIESYRKAVRRNPLDMNAHRNLNQLLYRTVDDASFLRSYDEAILQFPNVAELRLAKAKFLLLKEDFSSAQTEFEHAVLLAPDAAGPHDGLARVLAQKGEFESAIRHHETALRISGQDMNGHINFADTLLRAGDAPRALAVSEAALRLMPDHQGALAYLGSALELLGDSRATALNDYDELVQTFEISPPSGYRDIESFNLDLCEYLDRLHRDKREVLDQTLRNGTQTLGDLFGEQHDLVERLRIRIDEAVQRYISGLKLDERHPLMRRRRPSFSYAGSWSSRLNDCGFHTNHYHSMGWISSAYYVAVPDVAADVAQRQGWIKFGEPGFDAGSKLPIRRAVRPQSGTLVLFPSYMWHGTVPFHSRQDRTTVAFDVVPK